MHSYLRRGTTVVDDDTIAVKMQCKVVGRVRALTDSDVGVSFFCEAIQADISRLWTAGEVKSHRSLPARAPIGRLVVLGRPMSCMPGYFEVINTHTVGSLTIPRASIKWV